MYQTRKEEGSMKEENTELKLTQINKRCHE
jgi:hypothetical protein